MASGVLGQKDGLYALRLLSSSGIFDSGCSALRLRWRTTMETER